MRPSAYIGQFQFSRRGIFHGRRSGGWHRKYRQKFASLQTLCRLVSLSGGIASLNPRLLNRCRSPVLRTQYSQRCRTLCNRIVMQNIGFLATQMQSVCRRKIEWDCRRKFAFRGYHFAQPPAIESLRTQHSRNATQTHPIQLESIPHRCSRCVVRMMSAVCRI